MPTEVQQPRIKCYQCMRPTSTCICKHIRALHTKTRFIILMHPKEYRKEKNGTGHMTRLQLNNAEIIVGVDFTHNQRVNEILTQESSSCFLLYPGKENFNLSISQPAEINSFLGKTPHIFILDGTWPCARKMLKLSTNLQQLKRVSFDNKIVSKFIVKQQPAPLCLSTIESVYTVLNLLKAGELEQCNTKDFLLPFEKMLEYQLEYFQSTAKRAYAPKNRYKTNLERNIIFE